MAWWEKYLTDIEFRLDEELAAHRAEYKAWCAVSLNRQQRRFYLTQVAARLASPLYGNMLTYHQAKRWIAGNLEERVHKGILERYEANKVADEAKRIEEEWAK